MGNPIKLTIAMSICYQFISTSTTTAIATRCIGTIMIAWSTGGTLINV